MTFSIQEISEKIGISAYTLRYYEKEEIIPKIERNSSGHRIYKPEDIEWINFVTCLKSTGMPISEIRQFLELYKYGDSTIKDRKKLLVKHKNKILSKMERIQRSLETINWKISYYEELENRIMK